MRSLAAPLALTSLAALLLGAPLALAQQASTAAPAADSGGGLEEVVITAQKRTERLQDVAVAASVVSVDTIAQFNAGDISDLNRVVPSVNLNGTINGRVPLGVRGISSVQSEFNVGLASGVAIEIDGVPVPSDSRAANAIEDVQSVEVLKGPQGTLGGRAAAQGVINFVTHKPSDTLSGGFNATLTNDDEYRANGYIAGPIGSKVDFSLSAYGTARTFPITNLHLDKKTEEAVYGARGKLLFKPTDNLDITLMGRVGQDNSTGFNFVYTYITPGNCLLTGGCPPPFPFLTQAVLLPGITPSFNNLNYSSPIDVHSNVKDNDSSVDVQYRFGDLTFGSTTAFQHETQDNVQDLFAVDNFFWNLLTGAPGSGAPPFYNTQTQAIDIKQFSQEFKLASPTNQPFSYLVGLFYSDNKVAMALSRSFFPALNDYTVSTDTKTTALYGRTTWKFSPSNALVTGLRYNQDKIDYNLQQADWDAHFNNPPAQPELYFNQSAQDSNSESTLVGDVALQHFYAPDVMTYVSYSRGYAPAVFNVAEHINPANPQTGRAAHPKVTLAGKTGIDDVEIGAKGLYFDRRLSLNATAFYTKYKDFQVQAIIPDGSINPPSLLVNAGAETKGIEVDLGFAANRSLRLGLNVAYVDAVLTDFKNSPCYGDQTAAQGCNNGQQDVSGKPMPNAPKFKFTASVDQKFNVGGHAFNVGGNYAYRDSAVMLANQNAQSVMPSSGILNLYTGMSSQSGKSTLTLFVNNVTDKVYYTDLEDFWSGPWQGNAIVGQPARDAHRYYGVRFSTKL